MRPLRSGGHLTWHSIRLGRLMYWPPWAVTRPWLPRAELAGDEHCNPSILAVPPLLGAVIVFYGRRWRTEADGPCNDCIADMARDGLRHDGAGGWERVDDTVR
jgi:hypothetical protein